VKDGITVSGSEELGTFPKQQKFDSYPEMAIDPDKIYTAVIKTNKGEMKAVLDAANAPKTVNNFVFLARHQYYHDVVFHRIIPGFVVQGGDPTGTGSGGPGYRFEDELPLPGRYEIGSLAMANAGPDTNGSQFFIVSGSSGVSLPPLYALFGKVISGLEVLKNIDSLGSSSGRPKEKIFMESVVIMESAG
jgi:cyclophilin family peptidyl-prolyl cis-trans isomerase